MGNVSGKREEAESSRSFKIEDEDEDEDDEYMEYTHSTGGDYHMQHALYPEFTQQVPLIPSERTAGNVMINYHAEMPIDNGIPTMITWHYDGNHVAIEGSWDHWKTREFFERNGKEFNIMKMLESGVYRYRFIVDGHYRFDPDLPQECDESGNVFNVLDLQNHDSEVLNNVYMADEAPSSPATSYNCNPFSLEDYKEKLPELPPLLRRTPLAQPSGPTDDPKSLEKPLPAILNHLYIEKGHSGQSMVGLGSTNRFRKKYVTTVLYKPLKNTNR